MFGCLNLSARRSQIGIYYPDIDPFYPSIHLYLPLPRYLYIPTPTCLYIICILYVRPYVPAYLCIPVYWPVSTKLYTDMFSYIVIIYIALFWYLPSIPIYSYPSWTATLWHVFKTVQKNQPSFFAGCSSGSKTASWETSYTGAVCVWEFGMFTCMGRFLLILFLYYLENLLVGDLVFDRYWLSPDAGFHANHGRWGRLWFFRKWVVG